VGYGKCGVLHFGGNNLKNGASYALDQRTVMGNYIRRIGAHLRQSEAPEMQLPCRAVWASVELLATVCFCLCARVITESMSACRAVSKRQRTYLSFNSTKAVSSRGSLRGRNGPMEFTGRRYACNKCLNRVQCSPVNGRLHRTRGSFTLRTDVRLSAHSVNGPYVRCGRFFSVCRSSSRASADWLFPGRSGLLWELQFRPLMNNSK